MKKIISVLFPKGNVFEGSPCTITYEDGSKENTIADTFYMRCDQRGLTREEIKALTK